MLYSHATLQNHPLRIASENQKEHVFIYKYFKPEDGTLHITSPLKGIPLNKCIQIKEITVSPVVGKGIDKKKLITTIEVDRDIKRVKHVELTYSEHEVQESCLSTLQNSTALQRFCFTHRLQRILGRGTIESSLYNSTSLAYDMVKNGVAVSGFRERVRGLPPVKKKPKSMPKTRTSAYGSPHEKEHRNAYYHRN